MQLTAERNDSVAQFNDHRDSIYCVDSLPAAPFNVFVSGDGADKAYVWRLTKSASPMEEEKEAAAEDGQQQPASPYCVERVCELVGHTETVEFCKFDSTGKWLVTGGMNNFLRVWDVQNGFALK